MENQTVINKTVKSGITFGSALAMVISLYHLAFGRVGHSPWSDELGVCAVFRSSLLRCKNRGLSTMTESPRFYLYSWISR